MDRAEFIQFVNTESVDHKRDHSRSRHLYCDCDGCERMYSNGEHICYDKYQSGCHSGKRLTQVCGNNAEPELFRRHFLQLDRAEFIQFVNTESDHKQCNDSGSGHLYGDCDQWGGMYGNGKYGGNRKFFTCGKHNSRRADNFLCRRFCNINSKCGKFIFMVHNGNHSGNHGFIKRNLYSNYNKWQWMLSICSNNSYCESFARRDGRKQQPCMHYRYT